ncbi:MAG: hypothetical protein EOO41_01980, partial [Methanobacteriota archaeon]
MEPWLEGVEAFVADMTEDTLRTVTRDLALNLSLGVQRLARRTVDTAAANARAESLLLQIAIRCASCSQIMKRREGLKLVSEIYQLVVNATLYPSGVRTYGYGAMKDYTRVPTATWLTTSTLQQAISKASLVSNIFVDFPHRELVRMSGDIIRALDTEEQVAQVVPAVAAFIQAGDDKDLENALALVTDVATDVAPAFNVALLKTLFGDAERAVTWSEHHIKMLSALAGSSRVVVLTLADIAAGQPLAQVRTAALSALLLLSFGCFSHLSVHPSSGAPGVAAVALVHDSVTTVPRDVAAAARAALLAALQHFTLAPVRVPLMHACLRCIASLCFPLQAAELLQGILGTYPAAPKAPADAPAGSGGTEGGTGDQGIPTAPPTIASTAPQVAEWLNQHADMSGVLLRAVTTLLSAGREAVEMAEKKAIDAATASGGSIDALPAVEDITIAVPPARDDGAGAWSSEEAVFLTLPVAALEERYRRAVAAGDAQAAISLQAGCKTLFSMWGTLLSQCSSTVSFESVHHLWTQGVQCAPTAALRLLVLTWLTQGVAKLAHVEGRT